MRPSEAALFQLRTKVIARVRDHHAKREARLLINTDPSAKCIIYLVMYTRIINPVSPRRASCVALRIHMQTRPYFSVLVVKLYRHRSTSNFTAGRRYIYIFLCGI